MPLDPAKLIGRTVRFDHQGKRLVGKVLEAKPAGLTARGAIPDVEVTVQGASGAVLVVSYVETYMKDENA